MSMLSVYVGSYSPATEPGIHRLFLDPESGVLRGAGSTGGVRNPSFLAVHPGGRYLYAVSETGVGSDGVEGSVHAFRIGMNNDRTPLVPLGEQPAGGDHPCHIGVDPTGRWLAVSNYGSGSVGILPVTMDGGLGGLASMVHHQGSGPDPRRQTSAHAHCALFAPGGRFLVVADLGIDRLLVHAFDPATGLLTPHSEVAASAGAGPRLIAFHPDGSHLTAVNELDNTVSLYRWNGDTGKLTWRQTVSTLPTEVLDGHAGHLLVSPTGDRVLVSNRGHDSLAMFAFDTESGLAWRWDRTCGGSWPRSFSLVPTRDDLVAVANQHSDMVTVLAIDERASGAHEILARHPIRRPTAIAFAAR